MSSPSTVIVNDVEPAHIACVHKVITRFPKQVPENLRGMTLEQVTEFVQHTERGDLCNYDVIRDLIEHWAEAKDDEMRNMTNDMLKTAGENPTLEDKLAAILLQESMIACNYNEKIVEYHALPQKTKKRLIRDAEVRDDDKFNGGFMEWVERALYRYIDCVHIPVDEETGSAGYYAIDGISESVSSVLASMFAYNRHDDDEYTTWFMTYVICEMENDDGDDSGDDTDESGDDTDESDADTDDDTPTARMKRESKRRRTVHSPQSSQSPVPSSQ